MEPFVCTIQCRLGDVNFAGHVDNVEALRVVDEARARFLGIPDRHTGVHTDGLMAELPPHTLPVVGSHRLEYRRELFASLTDPYTVRVWVTHISRSSFTLDTTITHPSGGPDAAVLAETTLILTDLTTHGTAALPDAVRLALQAHLDEPLPLRPRPTP